MLGFLLISAAFAGSPTLLVGVDGPLVVARLRALAEPAGAQLRCWAPLCILDQADALSPQALRALPGVRYVEVDRPMDLVPVGPPPADIDGTTDCPDLWELDTLGVEAAWEAAGDRGGDAPVVAIQDSGFLLSHRDLGSVSGQFDYGDVDTIPEVSWSSGVPGHGTFIAGLISARDGNDLGRVGILPEGRLNLQKIADSSGALYFSYAVAAMLDLADDDLGVRVLNYSIASSSTTSAFDDAVAALGEVNILLVAAAGNCSSSGCWDADNDRYPLYPANSVGDHVLSVAGSTRSDGLNSYSHYGSATVDLAAPGVDLCSLDVGSDTDTAVASGTSYAAPLVAATAALVWGRAPRLTAPEIGRVLRASSNPTAALRDKVRADGVLSAENAVQTALARLDAPDDLDLEERAMLVLSIQSVAAAGTGTVLLIHGDGLSVRGVGGAAGWTAQSVPAGGGMTLPDAGTVLASRAATVLTGPLPDDADLDLEIELSGRVRGPSAVTVRLAASSVGADWLNAPYSAGSADETGFLAYGFTVDVQEVDPAEDTGDGSDGGDAADGGDDDGGDDGVGTDGADTGGPSDDAAPDPACGCASADPWGGAFAALLGLVAVGRRRRPAMRNR